VWYVKRCCIGGGLPSADCTLGGYDDAVAPIGAAVDDPYLQVVITVYKKRMTEQLHLFERLFVTHGFDLKRLGAHNVVDHWRTDLGHFGGTRRLGVALRVAPVASFVALNVASQCSNALLDGVHELVGSLFGAQQDAVLTHQRQLHPVVLVLLADVDRDRLDGAQVALECVDLFVDAGAGRWAEVAMLGANDEFHNVLPLTVRYGEQRGFIGAMNQPCGCPDCSTVCMRIQWGNDESVLPFSPQSEATWYTTGSTVYKG
jgi:hypothetical protein